MEFTALVASLVRRWYVVALGLLLTAGLATAAVWAVPPTYSAAGSVLLLPPGASVPEGSNQLLQLAGLEQPASLIVAYLAGDDVRESFAAKYPDVTYDVVLDPLSRGPLVMMTVRSPSSGTVMDALDAALATVPRALDSLQNQVDAPSASRFASMRLSVDAKPTTVTSSTLRALIAAVGLGMAITLAGAVSLDSLVLRRQQHRAAGTGRWAAASAHPQRSGPADGEPTLVTPRHDPPHDIRANRGRPTEQISPSPDDYPSEARAPSEVRAPRAAPRT